MTTSNRSERRGRGRGQYIQGVSGEKEAVARAWRLSPLARASGLCRAWGNLRMILHGLVLLAAVTPVEQAWDRMVPVSLPRRGTCIVTQARSASEGVSFPLAGASGLYGGTLRLSWFYPEEEKRP